MSTDIGAIMQLLQRQMVLVPPAYSTVSSPPQPSPYPRPGESLVQPVTPHNPETLASLSQILDSQGFEETSANPPEFLRSTTELQATETRPSSIGSTGNCSEAGARLWATPPDPESSRRLSLPDQHAPMDSRTPQRHGSDPGS
ncbi:hypothetical protein AAFF_G00292430 [Aldrovandia affinis]|uniref:Uncharacterized protein n=1 Tax=Aldrovandia affinis TaxID=143900 RepID=A0AAD7SQH0_9TELE|nr:hypothetical protein AAFF_G00292430 [Aldrovandia affinis]